MPRSLSILIHGPAKAGKSVLTASAPPPVLVLDAEGGTRFLRKRKVEWDPHLYAPPVADGSWEVCVVYVRDYETIEKVYQYLLAGTHPFRSVVLDSVSEVQQRCIDATAGTDQMRTQDWGDVLRKMSDLVRKMRDLTIHPSNPLEVIALVAMSRTQNGKTFPYVQGALAATLPYYLDVITYLYTESTDRGLERRLLVAPRTDYEAGDRTGYLDNGENAGVVAFPWMTPAQANTYPFIGVLLDMIYGPQAETVPVAAASATEPTEGTNP